MAEYTLTYDSQLKGWVSFYSYYPDKIVGMNNYLYTFKGGNLYQHNTNAVRNNFYGTQYNSQVTSVVNQTPLTNKVFKAFYLESDAAWKATFVTDKITGFIEKDYFEKKESDYFAFIRTDQLPASGSGLNYNTAPSLQLRSVNGIGIPNGISVTSPTEWRVAYPATTPSGSPFNLDVLMIGINDILYSTYQSNPSDPPSPIGIVTGIDVANNVIVVNPSGYALYGVLFYISQLTFSVKNSIAEANGLLGHYLEFTLENDSTTAVELFAVGADSMISEPSPRKG